MPTLIQDPVRPPQSPIPIPSPQNPLLVPPTTTTSEESIFSPEGNPFTVSMTQTTYITNQWTQVRFFIVKYYTMAADEESPRATTWAQCSECIRTNYWATGEKTCSRIEGEVLVDRGYGAGFEVVVPPGRRRIVTEASTREGMI